MTKYTPESIIKLNIGGESFATFHKTLTQSNYFVNLLGEDSLSGKTMTNKDEIFIDRSGRLFNDILYYLRTHSVFAKDTDALRLLQEEAKFYQLDDVVEISEQGIKDLTEIDNQKVSFIVKDADSLKALQGRTNYIVLEEEANDVRVYKIVDVMNVRKVFYCNYHYILNCVQCSSVSVLKLLLYPTNKQLR